MNERTITFITLGVLGVIGLSGGGGIFYVHTTIKKKKSEMNKLSAQIDSARQKYAAVAKTVKDPQHPDDPKKNKSKMDVEKEKADKEEAAKAGRIPFFRGRLQPGEPDIDLEYDLFFNHLDLLRHKAGIAITSGKWLPPKKLAGAAAARAPKLPPNLHKASFELVCWGLFKDLVQFLGQLERSGRYVAVETFVLTAGRGPVFGVHSMKVTLYTYAYKAAAPVAGAPKEEKLPETTPVRSTDYP